MANFLLAADAGLKIIPAINKASVCVCVSLHYNVMVNVVVDIFNS